ncbi:PREDICTED: uncharacterized protein LOC104759946 [Camelina sativa]|uniref:Uncharacterized protein LOC104759946 n=1 Tax=Camelina sativa TaxID=90675 RepID=A0ABM0X5N6_CAMSA|nr:PREDICTED: uncharacterized protein LOC104759946 [Camelina sativa]
MHRGLIHGVATELPMAEHRACARHIYGNLKRDHKSDMLKPLFWRIASSYNKADYKENLSIFKEFDPQACKTLLRKDPSSWCRAFFRVGCCCADTHNNHTESYNRTLKIARRKPFVQMLELVRRDAMQRVANRSIIAEKEAAKFTKKARKELEKSCEEAQYCAMISSTGGEYEIVEFGIGYSVSLNKRECACRKWDLTGIPCRHAVCAIRELNLEVEDYISDYYLSEKWKGIYRRGLRPSPESRAKRRKLMATPQLEAQDQEEMGAALAAMEHEVQPEMGGALVAMEHQDQDDAEVQDVSSTAP